MRTTLCPKVVDMNSMRRSLPRAVATFIDAVNAFDLEMLMAAFARDAVVNDQLREFRGRERIRPWAANEFIGEKVTMTMVDAISHYGNCIVNAEVCQILSTSPSTSLLKATGSYSSSSSATCQNI